MNLCTNDDVSCVLSVTAWAADVDILPELGEGREDDENQEDDSGLGRKASLRYSAPPHGHRAGPSHLHNPPSKYAIKRKYY